VTDLVSANIARHLAAHAAAQPAQAALKVPRGRRGGTGAGGRIDYLELSYAELSAEVAAWRVRLVERGVGPGDRTLVMVRQGLPLIAVVFALFELGALPVVIDPGMGRAAFLRCVAHSRPRVLVGIPLARVFSRVFRKTFRSVEVRVGVSGRTTARLTVPGARRAETDTGARACGAGEAAAILFTSGSTGAPKGVVYTHGQFDAQVRMIREAYGIEPGEVDLPLLPLFALFAPALGMTVVVPEIDPSRPARADPSKLVQAIRQEGVTTSFGSPTLWGNLAAHCHRTKTRLPTLRRVLCAGAPVPPWLWAAMKDMMPNGRMHSPYGATEALPVSTIAADEVLTEAVRHTLRGAGVCVGHVLAENEVRIIEPVEGVLAVAAVAGRPTGEIGEIIVRGPTVTAEYDGLPEATAAAKIFDEATGAVWHRMGDLGYLDAQGRLWFCGRKVETVMTERGPMYPAQAEPIFEVHAEVRRCALVSLNVQGKARPAIVVEPVQRELLDSEDSRRLARELRLLALEHAATASIKTFFFKERLPVDVRHNAKIHRLALTRWVNGGEAVGFESDPKR
jgi:acyl-CoA synthetase (AMP-forming)/AMP-acid ligase II